jgi:hypothetical protein
MNQNIRVAPLLLIEPSNLSLQSADCRQLRRLARSKRCFADNCARLVKNGPIYYILVLTERRRFPLRRVLRARALHVRQPKLILVKRRYRFYVVVVFQNTF